MKGTNASIAEARAKSGGAMPAWDKTRRTVSRCTRSCRHKVPMRQPSTVCSRKISASRCRGIISATVVGAQRRYPLHQRRWRIQRGSGDSQKEHAPTSVILVIATDLRASLGPRSDILGGDRLAQAARASQP